MKPPPAGKPLWLYPIGTKVFVGNDIPGVITGVMIEGNNSTTYRVAWWNERDRKSEWVTFPQLKAIDDGEPLQIGFVVSGPAP